METFTQGVTEGDFSEPIVNKSLEDNFNLSSRGFILSANVSESDRNETMSATQELYQVPTGIVVLLSLLYGAICVAALVGNLLVLCLVMVSKKMRTVTNLFIANLALADIIIAMFAIPFQFQAALLQRWNLPHFLCAFCPFVQVLSVTVSVLTLAAIAMDRYRAVMHPLQAKSSKRRAIGKILAIWLVSLLLALPTELDYSVIMVNEKGRKKAFCTNVWLSSRFRVYYNQSIVIIQYFFPLFIITGAYIRMGRELWRTALPGEKEEARDALVLRNKKKVIKMLSTVVLMFAICWFPLQTYNFLQTHFPSINTFQYINIVWISFHWLAMSNSCCNPFIYAMYNKKFKKELFDRIPCLARLVSWSLGAAASATVRSKVVDTTITTQETQETEITGTRKKETVNLQLQTKYSANSTCLPNTKETGLMDDDIICAGEEEEVEVL